MSRLKIQLHNLNIHPSISPIYNIPFSLSLMNPSSGIVQHVTKASSDELLRKFAELEDSNTPRGPGKLLMLRGPIRRKKMSRRVVSGLAARDVAIAPAANSSSAARRRRSGSMMELKSFLPTKNRRGGGTGPSLFRKIGVGKSLELRSHEASGIGILLAALEKTWRKTMEGASKMFVEKQCNGHVRLISDVP